MMKIAPGQLLLIEHFAGTLKLEQPSLLKEFKEEIADTGKLNRPVVVVGVIQRADKKNQNGRIYPYDVLQDKVQKYKDETGISSKNSRALGELDHCEDPIIHLRNVAHVLEDIWWDGPQSKDVWGKIRLLSTPGGENAKNIALDGIPLGISSRAVGSVDEKHDASYVKDDLQLICWDLVGTPSTDGAFLSPIEREKEMLSVKHESVDFKVKHRKINQTLNEILKRKW